MTNAATGRISGVPLRGLRWPREPGLADQSRGDLLHLPPGANRRSGKIRWQRRKPDRPTRTAAADLLAPAPGSQSAAGPPQAHPGTTANYAPLMGTVTNYGTITEAPPSTASKWPKAGLVDNRASGADLGLFLRGLFRRGTAQPWRDGLAGSEPSAISARLEGTGLPLGGGVDLGEGGTLVNGAPNMTTALISAAGNGVVVEGGRESKAAVLRSRHPDQLWHDRRRQRQRGRRESYLGRKPGDGGADLGGGDVGVSPQRPL